MARAVPSAARPDAAPKSPSFVPVDELILHANGRPNLLLVGNQTVTDAALGRLDPLLEPPVVTLSGRAASLLMPTTLRGTLILRGAKHLRRRQQARILEWLARGGRQTQIITISDEPLFPFVEQGRFLSRLYYQLNIVYVELGR